jgi:phospholipid-translocating ATPase
MDFTYSMFFNTVFTFLTTMSVGMFDQDLKSKLALLIPQSYLRGIRQELYSSERYWLYMAYGIYQSLVCYFGVYLVTMDATFNSSGFDVEGFASGTTMAFVAIFIINIYSTVNWYSWTWITVFSLIGSMISWIVYTVTYSTDILVLLGTPSFYATVTLLVFVGLLPKMAIKYAQQMIQPSDTDVLLEYQKLVWDGEHVAGMVPMDQKEDTLKKGLTLSKSFDQINKEKQDFVPVMDGFGHSPCQPVTTSPTASTAAMKKSQSLNPQDIDADRPRKPSFSNALKSGMTKIVKSFKGDTKTRVHRAGSLVYMGGKGLAVPNTGFAFSHDQGMEDIITPKRTHLEVVQEEPTMERKRRISHQGKLRNFSRSIQSVFRSYTRSIHSVHDDEKPISPSASQDLPVQQSHPLPPLSGHGGSHPPPFVPLNTIPSVVDPDPNRTSDPGYQFHQLCIQMEDQEEASRVPTVVRGESAPPGFIERDLESRSRAHSRTSRISRTSRTSPEGRASVTIQIPNDQVNTNQQEIPEISVQPPSPEKPNP